MTPEELDQRWTGTLAELLGIRFIEAGRARVIAEMTVRPEHCTVGARVHGGTLMAFADTVGAVGAVASLPDGAAGTTTLESKTNFFAGAPVGAVLRAESTPLHAGRRTSCWQTRITDVDGRLLAQVIQTQIVL